MAVLILSWIVVAFLFALCAHTLLPDDGVVDVDVTIVLGMAGALAGGALSNHLCGEPLWGVHAVGFAGGALGATLGVVSGALGQRKRRAERSRTS